MNNSHTGFNNEPDAFQEDWLSAYLDGELTAQQVLIVEQRLQTDENARSLLEDLKKIHGLVAQLPGWAGPNLAFRSNSISEVSSTGSSPTEDELEEHWNDIVEGQLDSERPAVADEQATAERHTIAPQPAPAEERIPGVLETATEPEGTVKAANEANVPLDEKRDEEPEDAIVVSPPETQNPAADSTATNTDETTSLPVAGSATPAAETPAAETPADENPEDPNLPSADSSTPEFVRDPESSNEEIDTPSTVATRPATEPWLPTPSLSQSNEPSPSGENRWSGTVETSDTIQSSEPVQTSEPVPSGDDSPQGQLQPPGHVARSPVAWWRPAALAASVLAMLGLGYTLWPTRYGAPQRDVALESQRMTAPALRTSETSEPPQTLEVPLAGLEAAAADALSLSPAESDAPANERFSGGAMPGNIARNEKSAPAPAVQASGRNSSQGILPPSSPQPQSLSGRAARSALNAEPFESLPAVLPEQSTGTLPGIDSSAANEQRALSSNSDQSNLDRQAGASERRRMAVESKQVGGMENQLALQDEGSENSRLLVAMSDDWSDTEFVQLRQNAGDILGIPNSSPPKTSGSQPYPSPPVAIIRLDGLRSSQQVFQSLIAQTPGLKVVEVDADPSSAQVAPSTHATKGSTERIDPPIVILTNYADLRKLLATDILGNQDPSRAMWILPAGQQRTPFQARDRVILRLNPQSR